MTNSTPVVTATQDSAYEALQEAIEDIMAILDQNANQDRV